MSDSIKKTDVVEQRNTVHQVLQPSSHSISFHADRRRKHFPNVHRACQASPAEAGVEIELTDLSTQPVDTTVYENPFDCDYGFLALPLDKNLVHPYS